MIAAMLNSELREPAFVCVRDPGAAEIAIAAGVSAEVTLEVGGKLDNVYNEPVTVQGTVTFAGPARFRFSGEGYTGVEMDMGRCAVIQAGEVSLLILGNSVMTVDPAMYRAVGLEPHDAGIVVVKSHIQFRAGYADIARAIILLDSPGMSSDCLESLPFVRIERPLFPFDRVFEFVPLSGQPTRGGSSGMTVTPKGYEVARRALGHVEGLFSPNGKECTMVGASRLTRRRTARLLGVGTGAAALSGRFSLGATSALAQTPSPSSYEGITLRGLGLAERRLEPGGRAIR